MSRLPHFPSHSNDRNGNVTIFTAPNIDNVHHYELVQLARIRITYLDPSLHLVSTLHSLRLFLRPDSSVRLCSPALALAHSDSRPDLSVHLCSPGGKCPCSLGSFPHPDLSLCLTMTSTMTLTTITTIITTNTTTTTTQQQQQQQHDDNDDNDVTT